MSNSTKDRTAELLHERLETVVAAYRGLLCSDEQRLLEAMLDFERSVWSERRQCLALTR